MTTEQLEAIRDEAEDRIWFDCCDIKKLKKEVKKGQFSQETLDRITDKFFAVLDKYNLDEEELDDFYHAYWSGVLATTRYILEGDDDIDALRYPADAGLLDI